jgi:hypothetical protein
LRAAGSVLASFAGSEREQLVLHDVPADLIADLEAVDVAVSQEQLLTGLPVAVGDPEDQGVAVGRGIDRHDGSLYD